MAVFTLALSEKVSDNDIEVAFELEETERVGEFVNSNLVNDGSEGSQAVKIRQGEDGAELVIRTISDGVHEDSEARNGRTNPLTLTLLPGPGYEVGTPSSATHYVIDDEAAWGTVGWEPTEVSVAEEDGFAELAVTLSKPYSYPLTLRTSSSLRSASSEADYDVESANVNVTFPALSRRATVRVDIVDDDQPEDPERFLMALVLPPTCRWSRARSPQRSRSPTATGTRRWDQAVRSGRETRTSATSKTSRRWSCVPRGVSAGRRRRSRRVNR